jgi:hypothetical protein
VSRTVALAPTDREMWRKLLRATHPDAANGDHDLFIWTKSVFEHVSGHQLEQPRSRRDPPKHHRTTSASGRILFETDHSFADLTHKALRLAEDLEEPYSWLLRLLGDCLEAGPEYPIMWRQQSQGATYRSLAAVAYRGGLSRPERVRWYRIAESVPLAQRHVGHIMSRLEE